MRSLAALFALATDVILTFSDNNSDEVDQRIKKHKTALAYATKAVTVLSDKRKPRTIARKLKSTSEMIADIDMMRPRRTSLFSRRTPAQATQLPHAKVAGLTPLRIDDGKVKKPLLVILPNGTFRLVWDLLQVRPCCDCCC